MALRKKGSRKITVEEEDYRWVVAHDKKGLHLVIESEESPGQRLVVAFDKEDEDGEATSVIPSLVEQIIKLGLKEGWKPEIKGKQIHLGHISELDVQHPEK